MSTPEPQYVTFDTSVGTFTVELYTAHAPKVSYQVWTESLRSDM